MDDITPPNENPEDTSKNLDKTIDESAIDPAQFGQPAQAQPDQKVSDDPNPYQQQQLPSGKEPIALGSGTIVGVLGTGGMAQVYKIWNEKLEVHRAVKILLPSGQKELLSRFETEAKITAKLHHPNIVEIYNVGDWNGLPYLEMELIEGISLDTLIEKYGRLPDCICSAIGIQIAKALAYAHSQEFLIYGKTYQGVIHRDLKPANIMISIQGDLKLMDFGIARPTEAGLHTMDGHIVGTLQYLSPEQLDGVAIDKRSDVYSFGTILYEVLTGTKTFPQSTITNLMKMKATNSYRRFNEFDFQTPVTLAKVAEKCLQIDRNNRYEGANELLNGLRKTHESLTADSPRNVLQKFMHDPNNYTVSRSRKRIPAKYIYIGGGIAALAVIIILLLTFIPGPGKIAQKKEEAKSTKPVPKATVTKKATVESTKVLASNVREQKQVSTQAETPVKKRPTQIASKKTQPATPKKTVTPKPKKVSPIKQLQSKYGTKNLVDIGEKACKNRNYSDALMALEAVAGSSPKKSLFLLWAYVEMKQFSNARRISTSFQSSDAFVELLKGRIEAASGKGRKALNHYEAALTKPSALKNRATIRNDALYYTALVHDNHYRNSPSAETRLQAMTAWNNLKKVYSTMPNHPRFKLANKKLATNY